MRDIRTERKVRIQRNPRQYSKVWITRWQIFVMVWCSVYIIADIIMNHAININNVIIVLVTSIPATVIPYFVKAYLETKQEVHSMLEEQKLDILSKQEEMEDELINDI